MQGEWESKCNALQRMVIVRCLRPDRVVQAATDFIRANLGPVFVSPVTAPLGDLAEARRLKPTPLLCASHFFWAGESERVRKDAKPQDCTAWVTSTHTRLCSPRTQSHARPASSLCSRSCCPVALAFAPHSPPHPLPRRPARRLPSSSSCRPASTRPRSSATSPPPRAGSSRSAQRAQASSCPATAGY